MENTRTTDLQLAAYLVASGYRLTHVEETNGRSTKVFVFEGVPQKIVLDFYSGQDDLNARRLFGIYHDVKRLAMRS